jgi:zinc finger HIT domain-containing protein 1
VRKILQSQKTFANHLDDYQAMLALAESNPAAAAAMNAAQAKPSAPATAASKSASPAPTPASTAGGSKRSAAAAKRAAAKEKQEQEKKKARPTPKAEPEPEPEAEPPQRQNQDDVEMADADTENQPAPTENTEPGPQTYPRESLILPAYAKSPPEAHPGDADPLLVSYIPPFPSDDELKDLMTAPPLSYLEARATWGEEERRYPVRSFCSVCGYWGRVKCMKCGTRVCALECLEAHREECITRYGL